MAEKNIISGKSKLKTALLYFDNYDYDGDAYEVFPKGIEYFEELSNKFNLDLKIINKKIRSTEESEETVKRLEAEKTDLIVMLIGTGPRGEAVLPVISKPWPVAIWSVPEPKSSGPLPLNSLMGANLVSSIALEHLKRDYPFKNFYGWPKDANLTRRFEITFRSLTGLKKIRDAKIGWLVGLVPGFFDFSVDENEILNKYGARIIKIDYKEIKKRLESFKEDSVELKINQIKKNSNINLASKELLKAAKIDLLLEETIVQYGFDAIALGCWPELMEDFGAAPCSSVARFTQQGIPVACEGDLLGAIDMILLKSISGSTPFLMDIISMDEKDESICAWHCGCTPPEYASGSCMLKNVWFELKLEDTVIENTMGAIYDLEIKRGSYTILRSMLNTKKTFQATGDLIENKPSWDGGRGWLGNLEVNFSGCSAKDFINTILVNGVPHHYCMAPGNWGEELAETAAWLRMDIVKKSQFENYLVY